jgi:tetratricopeptide (TPR) repeat protein
LQLDKSSSLFQISAGQRRIRRLSSAGRRCLCVAAIFAVALAAFPAQVGQGDVLLESNEQLFDVLAAINAAGYNSRGVSDGGDTTREGVRAVLAKEKIPVLPEIQTFYDAHKTGLDSGQNLGQYVSLALLLGSPPDFKLAVAENDLPPDARSVANLVPLLKEFYKQADLTDLWARVETHYRDQIERYSGPVRRTIALTDAYLRFGTGAYLGRTYAIYVDLLEAAGQVQGRIYRSDYYLVVAPSMKLKLNEIRYQYLHFLLDPLAVKYAVDVHRVSALQAVARKAPALDRDFKSDFSLLVTECLIRAVELRMDKTPAAEAQKKVQKMAKSGLILVPYFYDALQDYEKQPVEMSEYYKQMIDAIDPKAVAGKLARIKFSPLEKPAATPAPARVVSEQERMLDEADNDIYQEKYQEAKARYTEILHRFGPANAQALYGIAVADSFLRKPDLAREYFKKTIETTRDTRLVTWSHIYLGRIADLNGDRKEAIAQYRAASVTAAAYPEALRAVQEGLQAPYGSN